MLRWSSYNGVAFRLLMYDTIWHVFDERGGVVREVGSDAQVVGICLCLSTRPVMQHFRREQPNADCVNDTLNGVTHFGFVHLLFGRVTLIAFD